MKIRDLTTADLGQLLSLERRAFAAPWSIGMFVLEFARSPGVRLGAVSDGELVGYVIVAVMADEYHVMTLATAPEYRRQGVASALLTALIDRLGEGANYTLEVRASNAAAIALYERFGFVSVGTRPHYYPDQEDALIMWRSEGRPWEQA